MWWTFGIICTVPPNVYIFGHFIAFVQQKWKNVVIRPDEVKITYPWKFGLQVITRGSAMIDSLPSVKPWWRTFQLISQKGIYAGATTMAQSTFPPPCATLLVIGEKYGWQPDVFVAPRRHYRRPAPSWGHETSSGFKSSGKCGLPGRSSPQW